jgi:hypothetical protein
MTSTIKVNKIEKESGSTLTLGGPSTAVTLACGATQTGFGRTGTVDWCTTAKTSPLTGVSGNGYFINTTSGGVTVTLPSSPSAGDIVAVSDYAKTSATNNITICRNSSKIEGGCGNKILNTNGDAITLVYVDGTKGWKLVNTADQGVLQGVFVDATGGNTILTCGDFKTHIFTSDGTFNVVANGSPAGSNTVEYLVVAGGAGGGDGSGSGGGGAGGFRTTYPSPATGGFPISIQEYSVTVGAGGGASASPGARGSAGANSVFSTITSAGGGGGGSESPCVPNVRNGGAGGSGGGAETSPGSGGAGNTPPVSPPQGNNGGDGGGNYSGGGGGGAAAVGFQGKPSAPGAGGAGSPIATAFFGPTSGSYGTPGPSTGRYFAGGGGGGNQPPASPTAAQTGGAGGGGTGGVYPSTQATTGTANTGGGGGGGIANPGVQPNGSGGSGFVAIRYKFQ